MIQNVNELWRHDTIPHRLRRSRGSGNLALFFTTLSASFILGYVFFLRLHGSVTVAGELLAAFQSSLLTLAIALPAARMMMNRAELVPEGVMFMKGNDVKSGEMAGQSPMRIKRTRRVNKEIQRELIKQINQAREKMNASQGEMKIEIGEVIDHLVGRRFGILLKAFPRGDGKGRIGVLKPIGAGVNLVSAMLTMEKRADGEIYYVFRCRQEGYEGEKLTEIVWSREKEVYQTQQERLIEKINKTREGMEKGELSGSEEIGEVIVHLVQRRNAELQKAFPRGDGEGSIGDRKSIGAVHNLVSAILTMEKRADGEIYYVFRYLQETSKGILQAGITVIRWEENDYKVVERVDVITLSRLRRGINEDERTPEFVDFINQEMLLPIRRLARYLLRDPKAEEEQVASLANFIWEFDFYHEGPRPYERMNRERGKDYLKLKTHVSEGSLPDNPLEILIGTEFKGDIRSAIKGVIAGMDSGDRRISVGLSRKLMVGGRQTYSKDEERVLGFLQDGLKAFKPRKRNTAADILSPWAPKDGEGSSEASSGLWILRAWKHQGMLRSRLEIQGRIGKFWKTGAGLSDKFIERWGLALVIPEMLARIYFPQWIGLPWTMFGLMILHYFPMRASGLSPPRAGARLAFQTAVLFLYDYFPATDHSLLRAVLVHAVFDFLQVYSPSWIIAVLNRIRLSTTKVFRSPAQFSVLEENIRDMIENRKRQGRNSLKIMSLGASTGEEAFSIAASILDAAQKLGLKDVLDGTFRIEIIGVEPEPVNLEKAERSLARGSLKRGLGVRKAEEVAGLKRINSRLPLIRDRKMVRFVRGKVEDAEILKDVADSDAVFANNFFYQIGDGAIINLFRAVKSMRSNSYLFCRELVPGRGLYYSLLEGIQGLVLIPVPHSGEGGIFQVNPDLRQKDTGRKIPTASILGEKFARVSPDLEWAFGVPVLNLFGKFCMKWSGDDLYRIKIINQQGPDEILDLPRALREMDPMKKSSVYISIFIYFTGLAAYSLGIYLPNFWGIMAVTGVLNGFVFYNEHPGLPEGSRWFRHLQMLWYKSVWVCVGAVKTWLTMAPAVLAGYALWNFAGFAFYAVLAASVASLVKFKYKQKYYLGTYLNVGFHRLFNRLALRSGGFVRAASMTPPSPEEELRRVTDQIGIPLQIIQPDHHPSDTVEILYDWLINELKVKDAIKDIYKDDRAGIHLANLAHRAETNISVSFPPRRGWAGRICREFLERSGIFIKMAWLSPAAARGATDTHYEDGVWTLPADWKRNWKGFVRFDADYLATGYSGSSDKSRFWHAKINDLMMAWAKGNVVPLGLQVDLRSVSEDDALIILTVLAEEFEEHKQEFAVSRSNLLKRPTGDMIQYLHQILAANIESSKARSSARSLRAEDYAKVIGSAIDEIDARDKQDKSSQRFSYSFMRQINYYKNNGHKSLLQKLERLARENPLLFVKYLELMNTLWPLWESFTFMISQFPAKAPLDNLINSKIIDEDQRIILLKLPGWIPSSEEELSALASLESKIPKINRYLQDEFKLEDGRRGEASVLDSFKSIQDLKQNHPFWYKTFTILGASSWEEKVFRSWAIHGITFGSFAHGFGAWGWSIGMSLIGFSAAHIVARWIARAKNQGWDKGHLKLWEYSREGDISDFFKYLIPGLLFTLVYIAASTWYPISFSLHLPLLVPNFVPHSVEFPYIASAATHALYNAIVPALPEKWRKWLLVADLFRRKPERSDPRFKNGRHSRRDTPDEQALLQEIEAARILGKERAAFVQLHKPDEINKYAKELRNAGKLDEAEEILRLGIHKYKKDVFLVAHLVHVINMKGEPQRALPIAREAVQKFSGGGSVAYQVLLETLKLLGMMDEYVAELEKWRRTDPGSPKAMSIMADLMVERGNIAEAVRLLENCIRLSPRSRSARELLARIKRKDTGGLWLWAKRPAVDWLVRRGMRRAHAEFLYYVVIAVIFEGFVSYLLGRSLASFFVFDDSIPLKNLAALGNYWSWGVFLALHAGDFQTYRKSARKLSENLVPALIIFAFGIFTGYSPLHWKALLVHAFVNLTGFIYSVYNVRKNNGEELRQKFSEIERVYCLETADSSQESSTIVHSLFPNHPDIIPDYVPMSSRNVRAFPLKGNSAILIRRPKERGSLMAMENAYVTAIEQLRVGGLIVVNNAVLPVNVVAPELIGLSAVKTSGTEGTVCSAFGPESRHSALIWLVGKRPDQWIVFEKIRDVSRDKIRSVIAEDRRLAHKMWIQEDVPAGGQRVHVYRRINQAIERWERDPLINGLSCSEKLLTEQWIRLLSSLSQIKWKNFFSELLVRMTASPEWPRGLRLLCMAPLIILTLPPSLHLSREMIAVLELGVLLGTVIGISLTVMEKRMIPFITNRGSREGRVIDGTLAELPDPNMDQNKGIDEEFPSLIPVRGRDLGTWRPGRVRNWDQKKYDRNQRAQALASQILSADAGSPTVIALDPARASNAQIGSLISAVRNNGKIRIAFIDSGLGSWGRGQILSAFFRLTFGVKPLNIKNETGTVLDPDLLYRNIQQTDQSLRDIHFSLLIYESPGLKILASINANIRILSASVAENLKSALAAALSQ